LTISYQDDCRRNVASQEPWTGRLRTNAEVALPSFLLRQRWYPAKETTRPHVKIITLLPLSVPHLTAAVAVLKVVPPGHTPFRLFVPIAVVPSNSAHEQDIIATAQPMKGVLVDAFSVDAFVRTWIAILQEPSEALAGALRARRTKRLTVASLKNIATLPVRRLGHQQSNTSVLIGDFAILKVIRKLEDGPHPELEIARFLSTEARYDAVPILFGWHDIRNSNIGRYATTSILQSFVPNDGDGWNWTLGQLRHAAQGPAESPPDSVLSWSRKLGVRTGDIHRLFSGDVTENAFRPERISSLDEETWKGSAQRMAQRALDGLKAAEDRLDPETSILAERLISYHDVIRERLGSLGSKLRDICKTRHHGDYHLGQVLVSGGDAVIIDFEGEPLRPLAERRAKHMVLRDVASMVRSFSYVVAARTRAIPAELSDQVRYGMSARLQRWERQIAQTFLESYFAAVQELPSLPADQPAADRLLDYFLLEKALYEINYELGNRPDWLAIPLQGALSLLEGHEKRSSHTLRGRRIKERAANTKLTTIALRKGFNRKAAG
jgi:trehalose synthase-fused probable maltokinase